MTETPISKQCRKCKCQKSWFEFYVDKWKRDGLQSYCKDCHQKIKMQISQLKGTEVNSKRYEIKVNSLNSALKKVFDATPIAEAWPATAVVNEMKRNGTGAPQLTNVLGCLNNLKDIGLVSESEPGVFQRVKVRQREDTSNEIINYAVEQFIEKKEAAMQKPVITSKPVAIDKKNPIDRLTRLSARLRELADDMESAALDLAEQAEKDEQETAKMRQLQALLKSLG